MKLRNRIKEFIGLIKLMQPIGKLRVGGLAIYVLCILTGVGLLLQSLTFTYILVSILVVIVYIVGLLWITLNE